MGNITKTKPSFIKPSNNNYTNLQDELTNIHENIKEQADIVTNVNTGFEDVKKEFNVIKNSSLSVNSDVVNEIKDARGAYNSLSERFEILDSAKVLNVFENMQTTRTYFYNHPIDNELVTDEHVRGDINYNIKYIYDNDCNIVREERCNLNGDLIAYKDYKFENGFITTISGLNTDDVITATVSSITEDINIRLKKIEAIDFVALASSISSLDIGDMWNIVSKMASRIQHLETYLPENLTELIDLPAIVRRIKTLEDKLDSDYSIHKIIVNSSIAEYNIPSNIPNNISVYLEGLLLTKNEDYTMADNKIKFLIPLIDDFTVLFKF